MEFSSLPVLLVVTFRPEFDPPWIGQPHVAALTINRLAQREINAVIDGVVGNKLVSASARCCATRRATTKVGMANLVYNIKHLIFPRSLATA